MGSFIASVVFALLVATVCLLIGDCGADARLLISPTVGSALSRPGANKKTLILPVVVRYRFKAIYIYFQS